LFESQKRNIVQLLLVSLCLSAFFLQKAFGYSVALLLILLVADCWQKRKLPEFNVFIWLGIAFFGFHLLSLSYSNFPLNGLKNLETKLSFVVLPLILYYFLTKKSIRFTGRVFILSAFVCSFLCWFFALHQFCNELYCRVNDILLDDYPYTNFFFASRFSLFFHPGYFAMYLLAAIVLLLKKLELLFRKKEILRIILTTWSIIFLVATLFASASKSGMICLFVILLWWVIQFSQRYFKSWSAVISITAICILFAAVIYNSNWLLNSFKSSYYALNQYGQNVSSSELRLQLWKSASELIKDKPLTGLGVGNVEPELNKVYEQHGIVSAREKSLNTHNQFLQTWLTTGIGGFIVLTAMLFLPLIYHHRFRKEAWWMALILIGYSATESIFETQAGVVYFCFVTPLIFINAQRRTRINKKNKS
jgi:O-antigen ligase